MGEYDRGIDNYLIGIKLLPEYGVYYYQLAQGYSLAGNYFLGKEALNQAINKGFSTQTIKNDPLFAEIFKRFPSFTKKVDN